MEDKLTLYLYVKQPLRSDYKKIYRHETDKGNYYKDGKIYIPKAVKIGRSFVIDLPGFLIQEIEHLNQEFLINKADIHNYLTRISKKYFGKKMSINDFRHRRDFPPFLKKIYKIMDENSNKLNHLLFQQIKNY